MGIKTAETPMERVLRKICPHTTHHMSASVSVA
jgi:hypothetical protein